VQRLRRSDLNSPDAPTNVCLEALADTNISEAQAASCQAVMATKTGCVSVANNIG